jgi:hypothetical protein
MFNCGRCHDLAVICRRCDRGQVFRSPACARAARREAQQRSNARYQRTRAGARKHAARQASYRARMPKVTEQGPPEPVVDASVDVEHDATEVDEAVVREDDDADRRTKLDSERAVYPRRDEGADCTNPRYARDFVPRLSRDLIEGLGPSRVGPLALGLTRGGRTARGMRASLPRPVTSTMRAPHPEGGRQKLR